MAGSYVLTINNLTDTSVDIKVEDEFGAGVPSIYVYVNRIAKTTDSNGIASFTGLTANTQYQADSTDAASISFTTKATGYNTPRAATQEQWEDLIGRVKSSAEIGTSTILWTNPNPAANFAAQTVTLSDDLSNYSHIEVIATDDYTDSIPVHTSTIVPLGNKYLLKTMTAGVPMWRAINSDAVSSGTSFRFGAATWYSSYNSTNVSSSNQYLVPQKVIGYKW